MTGLKSHPLLKVQRAGVDYGLRLSLSVQQDQYYGSLRDSSGFKVMVHDQEEPPLINELGFAIQPGTHTFCGLRKEVVCNNRSLSRGAMLSLRGIKSVVFARQASPRREFSPRLALQKQSFFILPRLNMAAE